MKLSEPRKFKGVNWIGLYTLMEREVNRFLTVFTQTIVAPVVTTMLFYTIFALAFGQEGRMVGETPFLTFLAPGLVMMTMAQNAFANTSSSIMISKFQGNIVDVMMPPLSPTELLLGYTAGGIARGMCVGLATALTVSLFVELPLHSLGVILVFAMLGNMMLSSIGIAAGIFSERFDHISAITNFVITPLTFLSGTFYSIDTLTGIWRTAAAFNPFFYMIDGFRAGFTGHADTSLALGITILVGINVVIAFLSWLMLKTGYRIKT